jgi:hypothetical protein
MELPGLLMDSDVTSISEGLSDVEPWQAAKNKTKPQTLS